MADKRAHDDEKAEFRRKENPSWEYNHTSVDSGSQVVLEEYENADDDLASVAKQRDQHLRKPYSSSIHHQRNGSDPNQCVDRDSREVEAPSPPKGQHIEEETMEADEPLGHTNGTEQRTNPAAWALKRGTFNIRHDVEEPPPSQDRPASESLREEMNDSAPRQLHQTVSNKSDNDSSSDNHPVAEAGDDKDSTFAKENPYLDVHQGQKAEENLEDSDDSSERHGTNRDGEYGNKVKEEDPRDSSSQEKTNHAYFHREARWVESAAVEIQTEEASAEEEEEEGQYESPEEILLKMQRELVESCHEYSAPAGIVGLRNLGNTCFFNSVLQALSHISPLRRYFLEVPFSSERAVLAEGHMADVFRQFLAKMWCGRFSCVSPSGMLRNLRARNPMFEGFNQHDAQEALRFLLDHLHDLLAINTPHPYARLATPPILGGSNCTEVTYSDEMAKLHNKYRQYLPASILKASIREKNGPSAEKEEEGEGGNDDRTVPVPGWLSNGPHVDVATQKRSFISDLFQGTLANRIRCHECEQESVTFDHFWDLSLPIAGSSNRHHLARMADTALRSRGRSLGDVGSSPEHQQQAIIDNILCEALREEPSDCDLPFLLPKAAGAESSRPSGNLSSGVSMVTNKLFKNGASPVAPPSKDEAGEQEERVASDQEELHEEGLESTTSGSSVASSDSVWKQVMSKLTCPSRRMGKFLGLGSCDLSLYDLFYKYCDREVLSDTDAYHCNRCEKKVTATKMFSLVEPPPVLCLHLKRFSYSPRSFWGGSKIDTGVRFPLKGLDVWPFVWQGAVPAAKQQLREASSRQDKQVREGDIRLPHKESGGPQGQQRTFTKAPFSCPSAFFPSTSDAHTSEAIAHNIVSQKVIQNRVQEKKRGLAVQTGEGKQTSEESSALGDTGGHEKRHLTLGYNTANAYRSDYQYDLVALVQHLGGFGGGHYISFTKHSETGKWHLYDDESVREVSEETVASAQAYLLFYVRRDVASCMTNLLRAFNHGGSPLQELFVTDNQKRCIIPSASSLEQFFFQRARRRVCERMNEDVDKLSLDSDIVKKVLLLETVPFMEQYILQKLNLNTSIISLERLKEIELPQFCFVSRDWWLKWQTVPNPGPVTSWDIISAHGYLKRTLAEAWTRRDQLLGAVVPVPVEVYAWWVVQFGASGPPIWELEACPHSTEEIRLLQERRDREYATIRAIDSTKETTDSEEYELRDDATDAVDYKRCWFLLSSSWLQRWREFVFNKGYSDATGRGVLPPGPVDNAKLLHPNGKPHSNLKLQTHYRGVNYKVWEYFMQAYGGGPTICRRNVDIYDTSPLPRSDEELSDDSE
eukprot:gb/GECG01014096.1/.p1 GENE.gb/GECG01014096.1/~~gb/GECG01014096.1/.p1  ORF type:complete len:1323 (+),score=220.00 gb/GECG01014096.1/:1-3969(+)